MARIEQPVEKRFTAVDEVSDSCYMTGDFSFATWVDEGGTYTGNVQIEARMRSGAPWIPVTDASGNVQTLSKAEFRRIFMPSVRVEFRMKCTALTGSPITGLIQQ